MKISTEQLSALLAQQELQSKRQMTGAEGFDSLLNQELQNAGAGNLASMPPPGVGTGIIGQILMGESSGEMEKADPFESIMQQAFSDATGTMELWESYTKALSDSSQTGLREAYGVLQGIDSKMAALKESTASIKGRNPGLDSVMNELEVMAFTEKFKFNRGDYN